MEIVLKPDPEKVQLDRLTEWIKELNLELHFTDIKNKIVMDIAGDTSMIDMDMLGALQIVESVKRVS